MTRHRILIADDHQLFAECLRNLLERDYEIVDVVNDGQALLAAVEKYSPDLVIADISMPNLNGIEAVNQLRSRGYHTKIIYLTMHRDISFVRQAMGNGAGFVLKHSTASELLTAIHEVLLGKTYITPSIAGELLQSYRDEQSEIAHSGPKLTARRREVLQLVAEGCSAKEIAAKLKISIRTAEAHKARILDDLGLQTTADLVKYAIRNGLIALS